MKRVDETDQPPSHPVSLLLKSSALCRHRFNEWGRAALQFQLKHLSTSSGNEYFFAGYYRDEGAKECGLVKSEVAGALMSATTLAAVSQSTGNATTSNFGHR